MQNSSKKLVRRCPRLGNEVPFHYCQICGDQQQQQPCFKILDCWWEYFDVVRYLKNKLSPDQFNKLIHTKPKPKVTSILELVEQAKKRHS